VEIGARGLCSICVRGTKLCTRKIGDRLTRL